MQIKVFHPHYDSSIFCKEIISGYLKSEIKIYKKHDFIKSEEIQEIMQHNKIVFVAPIWWYSLPYNFVKWTEMLSDQKEIFKTKEIKFIIAVGGNKERYKENTHNSIKNMNQWVVEFFGKVEWEIYYGCIPKNINDLRSVRSLESGFERGDTNDG